MKRILKIVSLLGLWGLLTGIVVYIDPALVKDVLIPGGYLPFFGLVLIVIWYTLALVSRRMWGSLLIALTMVGGMLWSTWGIMHLGLLIVMVLTLAIESWYIYSKK